MSLPCKRTEPEIEAFGERVRPMIVWALTLLPEPDSPTMPRISPGFSSKETPSTAPTMPSSVANLTRRSSTESSGSGRLATINAPPPQLRFRGLRESCGGGPQPDAGIEIGVDDVHDRVEEDDEECTEHRHRHERRQVERPDRLPRVEPDAREVVHGLGEDRPASDHRAEVEPEQGDDRDQRIAEDVTDAHLAL